MKPPILARALLAAVAGEAEAECVAGDLVEEFAYLAGTRGRFAMNHWYLSQVVRSVLPLLRLRVRSGELGRLVLGAVFGFALPLLLLDRLWRLVYSEIPRKDGLDRSPAFLAVNVLALCVCGAISGSSAPSLRQAASRAAGALAMAGIALWASAASIPAAYAVLVLVLAPVSLISAYVWKRRRPV